MDWNKYLISKRRRDSKVGSFDGKCDDKRNAFESDFGRVIFSPALKRMHDKTQVIPLTSGDYIHTRLPHSIEVMNIADSICIDLCRNDEFLKRCNYDDPYLESKMSAIVKTAALVHDIGNTPFGHFGEDAIKNFFVGEGKVYLKGLDYRQKLDFTSFDGNAQGFRILTKLQYLGDLYGLNLTYATLGAFLKYPNPSKPDKDSQAYIGDKKHGIFFTEEELFNDIAKECSMISEKKKGFVRHPLSFIVEAADSICYDIMDIEDGIIMKWFSLTDVIKFLNDYIPKHYDRKKVPSIEYFDIKNLIGFKESASNDKKKVVDFRVKIIQYLVNKVTRIYIDKLEDIDKGIFNKELLEEDEYKVGEALLAFAKKEMYTQKDICLSELTGEAVISKLLKLILSSIFHEDKNFRNRIKYVMSQSCLREAIRENYANETLPIDPDGDLFNFDIDALKPYFKVRMAVDWVSGMTDKYAVEVYQRLSGHSV